MKLTKHGVCVFNCTMFGQFHNGGHGGGRDLHLRRDSYPLFLATVEK